MPDAVDGYTLTLAVNLWNIVRTYNLTPGRELLFACRYRLGTASNFVVYMSEADNAVTPPCFSQSLRSLLPAGCFPAYSPQQ